MFRTVKTDEKPNPRVEQTITVGIGFAVIGNLRMADGGQVAARLTNLIGACLVRGRCVRTFCCRRAALHSLCTNKSTLV